MAENGFEKTEPPTQRRREEARQEGNVARSPDLTAAATLLAGILLLHVLGLQVLGAMKLTVQEMLANSLSGNLARHDDLARLGGYSLRMAVGIIGPVLLALAAAALLAAVAQVGFNFTTEPLAPKLSKLSPLRGLGNLFSMRGGFRLLNNLFKVGLIATVAAWVVRGDMPRIVALAELEVLPMLAAASELVFSLALKLALLLLVLGLADYAYQRWQREQDLRMTKQEIREEMKRMEGDPLMRQRRSRVARQIAMQRVGMAVPQADVVVTNPTHFAVALRYDAQSMKAPKVVAKGADFLAQRIRQLALAHDVPLVERKDLARALYKSVEVGQEVPPAFYNAVAEILAYVYRLAGRKSA